MIGNLAAVRIALSSTSVQQSPVPRGQFFSQTRALFLQHPTRRKINMDVDTASDNTSIDDKTEDFCENPTRDALTEGLMSLLKPTVDQLDERIRATRISQIELKQQIESLSEELVKISEYLQCPLEVDGYVKKLVNAKHRVTIVSNVLQTTQERLNKVHEAVERDTSKRKALLDNSSMYAAAPRLPEETKRDETSESDDPREETKDTASKE